jgi:hypothetical protein
MKRIDAGATRIDLDELIRDQQAADRRPRPTPREVLAGWQNNAGAGIGAAVIVGIGGYVVVLPDWPLWAMAAGGVVFGVLMVAHGGIDEALAVPKLIKLRRYRDDLQRDARAQVTTAERERDLAFREIVELENAVQRLTFERDNALLEVQRVRNQRPAPTARQTYTSAAATQPQEVIDATAIIQHWFSRREWLSRRVATDPAGSRKWSERRHDAAVKLLSGAGLVVTGNAGGKVMAASEAEALGRLNAYCITANLGPPIETVQQRIVVDEEA